MTSSSKSLSLSISSSWSAGTNFYPAIGNNSAKSLDSLAVSEGSLSGSNNRCANLARNSMNSSLVILLYLSNSFISSLMVILLKANASATICFLFSSTVASKLSSTYSDDLSMSTQQSFLDSQVVGFGFRTFRVANGAYRPSTPFIFFLTKSSTSRVHSSSVLKA